MAYKYWLHRKHKWLCNVKFACRYSKGIPTERYAICVFSNSETSNLESCKIYENLLHVAGSKVISWLTILCACQYR